MRVFADKAAGYGIPAITIDGTDPEAIAAAFAWAAERARDGRGPALIELVAMRMCGHAHHDDMLYLGKDPQPSWDLSGAAPSRATPIREPYAFWAGARSDRRPTRRRLDAEGIIADGDLDALKQRGRGARRGAKRAR